MAITFRDFLTFPFNNGRGIMASQIDGEFIKSLSVVGDTAKIMVQKSDGTSEEMRFVGGVQRGYQVLGIGVGNTQVFSDHQFDEVGTHPQGELDIPEFTGNKYLAIWYQAIGLEINVVQLSGSPINHIEEFNSPVALNVGSIPGFYVVTKNTIKSTRSGEEILVYNTSGSQTKIVYYGEKDSQDGNIFTAGDFTGEHAFSVIGNTIVGTFTPVSTESRFPTWRGIAVIDSSIDISSALIRGFQGPYSQEVISSYERQAGTIEIMGVIYKVWVKTTESYARSSGDIRIAQEEVL